MAGPKAAFSLLQQSLERPESVELERLASLDWEGFVEPVGRPMRYVVSAFVVRYLLHDKDSRTTHLFRAYLELLSREELLNALELAEYLESDWAGVEEEFGIWVGEQGLPF